MPAPGTIRRAERIRIACPVAFVLVVRPREQRMAQRLQHVASDGVSLAVEVLGKGPPLLFAHGLGSCRHRVKQILRSPRASA